MTKVNVGKDFADNIPLLLDSIFENISTSSHRSIIEKLKLNLEQRHVESAVSRTSRRISTARSDKSPVSTVWKPLDSCSCVVRRDDMSRGVGLQISRLQKNSTELLPFNQTNNGEPDRSIPTETSPCTRSVGVAETKKSEPPGSSGRETLSRRAKDLGPNYRKLWDMTDKSRILNAKPFTSRGISAARVGRAFLSPSSDSKSSLIANAAKIAKRETPLTSNQKKAAHLKLGATYTDARSASRDANGSGTRTNEKLNARVAWTPRQKRPHFTPRSRGSSWSKMNNEAFTRVRLSPWGADSPFPNGRTFSPLLHSGKITSNSPSWSFSEMGPHKQWFLEGLASRRNDDITHDPPSKILTPGPRSLLKPSL